MQLFLLNIAALWGIRDPFSMLSHLLGALLGIGALVLLLRRGSRCGLERRALLRLATYGLTMIFAFSASALFHFFIAPPEHLVFYKKLDHAAIFLFIAGTCTAAYGALQVHWVPRLLAGIWLIALGALVLKMIVWPMALWLTASVYLGVGLIAAAGLGPFVRIAGWQCIRPVVWGSGLFSIGAIIFAAERPVLWPGVVEAHEIFHVLVLLGAALHYVFIYRHCTRPDAFSVQRAKEHTTLSLEA